MTREIRTHLLPNEERESVLRVLSTVLGNHAEVLFAYAYGSFLEDGPFRDLDVAVYLQPDALPQSRFHYEDCLAQEIVTALVLPFPLDLRLLNDAPIAFQYHVFRGSLLVDRDPELRSARLAHVVARYLDMKPILEHHLKEAFGGERGEDRP